MYKFKWKDPADYTEPVSYPHSRRDHRDPTADEAIRNVMWEEKRKNRSRRHSKKIAEAQKK